MLTLSARPDDGDDEEEEKEEEDDDWTNGSFCASDLAVQFVFGLAGTEFISQVF